MGKGRVEAFSDAVIAIIMTIMVLELRAPLAAGFEALIPLVPRSSATGSVLSSSASTGTTTTISFRQSSA